MSYKTTLRFVHIFANAKTSHNPNIYVYMDFALKSRLPILNQELNSLDLTLQCENKASHNTLIKSNF